MISLPPYLCCYCQIASSKGTMSSFFFVELFFFFVEFLFFFFKLFFESNSTSREMRWWDWRHYVPIKTTIAKHGARHWRSSNPWFEHVSWRDPPIHSMRDQTIVKSLLEFLRIPRDAQTKQCIWPKFYATWKFIYNIHSYLEWMITMWFKENTSSNMSPNKNSM